MLKKILHGIGVFISLLLITLATLLSFSISWMFKTWTNLSMDELVYHLTAPIEGTNKDMILNYLQSCLVPTILILLIVIICICSEPPLVENDIRVSVQRFADSRECIYSMLAG